ncbi:hypothetical protein ACFL0V_02650 [Nanoarchaeota archaeon]
MNNAEALETLIYAADRKKAIKKTVAGLVTLAASGGLMWWGGRQTVPGVAGAIGLIPAYALLHSGIGDLYFSRQGKHIVFSWDKVHMGNNPKERIQPIDSDHHYHMNTGFWFLNDFPYQATEEDVPNKDPMVAVCGRRIQIATSYLRPEDKPVKFYAYPKNTSEFTESLYVIVRRHNLQVVKWGPAITQDT